MPSEKGDDWVLKVDGKPDERINSLHDMNAVDLILHDEDTEQRQNDLIYARGRIFRPCEKSASEKGGDREAELEAVIEKARAETSKLEAAIEKAQAQTSKLEAAIETIRAETSKPGQTLPKLRRAISRILQELGNKP